MTATVGIDPRIRARRIAVRRGEGRKRLRRLQALGAVLGAFAVSFALTRSPAMDVDHVRIEADGVDESAVRDALGVRTGQPMTEVDPRAAADAVAALPQVGSVDVRRAWPNAVSVRVTAREPGVAVAAAGGGWLVADGAGGIMAAVDERPGDLVVLGGIELVGRPGQVLPAEHRSVASVGAALPADLRNRAAHLTADGGDRIELALADGGSVVFAAGSDLQAAAGVAAAVVEAVPPGCVDAVDVVVPSAPVLRRAPGC